MKRMLLVALTTLAVAAGCTTGPVDNPGGDVQSTTPKGKASATQPTHITPADGRLPKVTDQASVEPAMMEIIKLAITNAPGVPAQDRTPVVTVTAASACGVPLKAMACLSDPMDPKSEIVIYLNPGKAWEQFNKPSNGVDPQANFQGDTLTAVMQYITYRKLQRERPDLLFPKDAAASDEAALVSSCASGQVYGGVGRYMEGELPKLWRSASDRFLAGTQGKC